MTKLQKSVVDAWVRALRSGNYQQTEGRLRRQAGKDYSYCCLGVLTEVCKRFFPDKEQDLEDSLIRHSLLDAEIFIGDLGFKSCSPTVEGAPSSLILMNDTSRMTFDQIADVIETNPESLFKSEEIVV